MDRGEPFTEARRRDAESIRSGNGGLAALAGTGMETSFHYWAGASGRHYVASVFAVDPEAPDAGLPDFEGFVLVCVASERGRRIVHDVAAVERSADRRRIVARALAAGIDEWHVHLRGEVRAVREAIVADLGAAWIAAPAMIA